MTEKLKKYNDQIIKLVKKCRGEVENIRGDIMIPEQSKDQLIREKRREFHSRLKSVRAVVDNEIEAVKSTLDKQMRVRYVPDSNKDAAAVAKDEATWRRLKSLLDSDVTPDAIAQDAADRGDTRAIKVLGQEYPAYMWGKTGDSTSGDHIRGLLAPHKYATGSDGYREAADARAEIDSLAYTLNFNLNHADVDCNPEHSDAGKVADQLIDADRKPVDVEPDANVTVPGDGIRPAKGQASSSPPGSRAGVFGY